MNEVRACVRAFLQFDYNHYGGMALQMWPGLLRMCFPEFNGSSLEDMMVDIVGTAFFLREEHFLFSNGWLSSTESGFEPGFQLFDFIEFFAGSANLTRELLKKFHGCAFDILFEEGHDVLSSDGLKLWIESLCLTRDRALVWIATTCSSFISLCISVSKRNAENHWMGDHSRDFVLNGNCQMIVSALMYFLSRLLGNVTLLEQPLNSSLPNTPLMSSVLTFCSSMKVVTYLGSYGGKTAKPLQVWSSSVTFQDLHRPRPEGLTESLVERGQNGSFTGKKAALEESGVYPPAFGAKVASLFEHETSLRR